MSKEIGSDSGGSIGFEIFDRSDALGTTNFVQNINFVRALEGELSCTIRSLDKVAAARVHLVLPRRELFSRETQEPSASIILRTIGAGQLDKNQVASIQHLVAVYDFDRVTARLVKSHGGTNQSGKLRELFFAARTVGAGAVFSCRVSAINQYRDRQAANQTCFMNVCTVGARNFEVDSLFGARVFRDALIGGSLIGLCLRQIGADGNRCLALGIDRRGRFFDGLG